MTTERGEYNGKATIVLLSEKDTQGKYPFSFGLSKARLILENIDDIKKLLKKKKILNK